LFINTPSFSAKIRSSKRKERNGISNEKKKKKFKKKKKRRVKTYHLQKVLQDVTIEAFVV
jgi:hypothetical protein